LRAGGVERKANPVRPQVREFGYAAQGKRGAQRQALEGESGFAPVWGGGLRGGEGPQRAVATAATALGARVVGLTGRVVSRGCALPVAGTVWAGNTTQAWRGQWRRLWRQLRPALPGAGTVLGLAARGLAARGL